MFRKKKMSPKDMINWNNLRFKQKLGWKLTTSIWEVIKWNDNMNETNAEYELTFKPITNEPFALIHCAWNANDLSFNMKKFLLPIDRRGKSGSG